jgi:hypothetical protein
LSLTATAQRLDLLHEVLRGLLAQSRPADRVLLWLSHEPFLLDQGVQWADLPAEVREMERRGLLEIAFTANTGPHRKLIPTLKSVRSDENPPLIVTADDDIVYPVGWLESLVDGFNQHGSAVCFRARRVGFDGSRFLPYDEWPRVGAFDELLSYRLLVTGKQGLLIHPEMLDTRIFDPDFAELSPSRSDVWIAGALMGRGTRVLKLSRTRLYRYGTDAKPMRSFSAPRGAEAVRGSQHELYRYNVARNDRYIGRTLAFFGSSCRTVREFLEREDGIPVRPPDAGATLLPAPSSGASRHAAGPR